MPYGQVVQVLERSDQPGRDSRWGSGDKLASIVRRGYLELPGKEWEAGNLWPNSRGVPRFDILAVVNLDDILLALGAFFFNDGTGVRLGPVIVVNVGVPHPQEADKKDSREDGGEEECSGHSGH